MKLKVSFVVTSAAALNEDLRLEVAAACAFDIVAYMVAVFFGGEPRDNEFAAVDAQPRNVHGFRRCGICDLNDLLFCRPAPRARAPSRPGRGGPPPFSPALTPQRSCNTARPDLRFPRSALAASTIGTFVSSG